MKERVRQVIFCGGHKFSTREMELEVITSKLERQGADLLNKYDFSSASFEFLHDNDNNRFLGEYENLDHPDYKKRRWLQVHGGLLVSTERRVLGTCCSCCSGKVIEFS